MSEENKRLVRRLVNEIWNQGKLELIDELVDANYVRHDPAWPEPIHGQEGLRQYIAATRHAIADGQFTIEDLIAEGDKVVTRWTLQGTQQGEFMGIPPTWREVSLTGISIMRVENGRIAEVWDGYDALSLMQQLGVVP
jgi:steroid delta-isomerase-like uncharacterized protein